MSIKRPRIEIPGLDEMEGYKTISSIAIIGKIGGDDDNFCTGDNFITINCCVAPQVI